MRNNCPHYGSAQLSVRSDAGGFNKGGPDAGHSLRLASIQMGLSLFTSAYPTQSWKCIRELC